VTNKTRVRLKMAAIRTWMSLNGQYFIALNYSHNILGPTVYGSVNQCFSSLHGRKRIAPAAPLVATRSRPTRVYLIVAASPSLYRSMRASRITVSLTPIL
jgi:hypothetical protein